MALFSKKQDTDVVAADAPKKEQATPAAPKAAAKPAAKKRATKKGAVGERMTKGPGRILKGPRVTEKAAYMTMQHAYVFEVAQDATKRDVIAVVRALYNVTPRKVNIVRKQPRAYVARTRNRIGTKSGMKKAYVFLQKGDKIDLV